MKRAVPPHARGLLSPFVLGTLIAVLTAWATPLVAAPQSPKTKPSDLVALRLAFGKGLKSDRPRARVSAVETLAAASEPASIPWLLDALSVNLAAKEKHHRRYQKIGRKLNDRSSASVPLNRPATSPNLAELQGDLAAARRALEGAERVVTALRKAIRTVATSSDEARRIGAEAITRATRRAKKPSARAALAETLGHLPVDAARETLVGLLGDKSPEVRIAAAAALGRSKSSNAIEALSAAVEDGFWQVRVSAIEALGAIGGRAGVDALIIAMAKVEGRLIDDVRTALTALTGKDFHDNRALWRDWWRKHRGDYDGPPVAKDADKKDGKGARAGHGGKAATRFYGIQTRSKRLIYILDLSGSMNYKLRGGGRGTTGRSSAPLGERKVDQAIIELKKSITALPNDATFNIVFYNHEVSVYKKKQIVATDRNKKKAIAWAEAVGAVGNTNIFDGLERAFRLAGRGTFDKQYAVAADTFYLLSDGRSNRGRITGGNAMRKEVARLNKFRKVVIHAIALGNDADRPFMKGLAQDSGGEFVHVGFRGRRREP